MDAWATDQDMWVRRSAMLHQLFTRRPDPKRLFAHCCLLMGEKEFFIRKAVGWALRQYARSDAAAVQGFVASHVDSLSPLAVREALKHCGSAATNKAAGDSSMEAGARKRKRGEATSKLPSASETNRYQKR